jgi:phosphatidylglycerophosphatase A
MPLKEKIIYGIASGLGAGYLPKAPGTWGSLVGLIGVIGIGLLPQPLFILAISTVLLSILGLWVSHYIIHKSHPPADLDPTFIVIDEIVGVFIAAGVVAFVRSYTVADLIIIFILFRILDITKPGPIGYVDRRLCAKPSTAPWGIMIDDILAGFLAGLLFSLFFG